MVNETHLNALESHLAYLVTLPGTSEVPNWLTALRELRLKDELATATMKRILEHYGSIHIPSEQRR